jgi:glycosyltransferase involved in cell wall biosynthesis
MARREQAPGQPPADRTVTILMGLHNGAAHLGDQLHSLEAQRHADWRLIVSDDGSTDDGPALVRAFAARHPPGRVRLVTGPGRGVARNYLFLLGALPEAPGWVAFADQDDIWLPERLERGIAALLALPGGAAAAPALHCARTLIFRQDPRRTRLSPPRPRPPGFRNALVQNIAAGNTILLNPAAARLLRAAAPRTAAVVVHDWWAYLLISGATDGRILHDDRPALLYRQHGGNLIGANDGLGARLHRLRQLLAGTMRDWTDVNLAALAAAEPWLSAEAKETVARLRALRATPGLAARLADFRRLGLYRQTRASTLALWLMVAIRRL